MKLFSSAFKFISSVVSGAFNFVANLFRDPAIQAMGRAGLSELGQIVPAFKDSVQPSQAYGLIGNPLPQTIHENLKEFNAVEPELNRDMEFNKAMEPDLEMQM